jgi:beta-lactamase regulating signal transducer with metallopeptidase domain
MNVLNQSAFLKALGWSLLDSFWQMGILWLLYVLLTGNGKKFHSKQRHSLALLSLIGGSLWFVVTLAFHFYETVNAGTVIVYTESSLSPTAVISNSSITLFFSLIEPIFPFLSLAYLLTILYLFIRLYRQYYATQKLFSTGTYKVRPELRVFLKHIAAQMGIKKEVRIWLSNLVDTPLTIGFWKPVILLPVAAVNHLSLRQAEAIILHELNHIRRNDYVINLLIACMDIILFFNPFVRILTHIIKNERENCCDDMVLQFRYDAEHYANALLLLEKNRVHTPELTIAATGKNKKLLLKRVERILYKKNSGMPINQKLIAYVLSALVMGFIGWYNPGKVIVKTIDSVQNITADVNTEQISFPISDLMKDEISKGNGQIELKKKVQAKKIIEPKESEKDQQKEQEIVEWATEQMPVGQNDQEASSDLVYFIGSQSELREYSIPENTTAPAPSYHAEIYPYVPSVSFSFQIVEDTALPKKHLPTPTEIKAQESMTIALRALQEIDWQKLEKEMSAAGKKVDIIKLQAEMKKALTEVDWKKVNEEMQASLIDVENELVQDNSALRTELHKFQQDRTTKRAKEREIYKAIIHDRLCPEKGQQVKPSVQKKITQKKKIVYI